MAPFGKTASFSLVPLADSAIPSVALDQPSGFVFRFGCPCNIVEYQQLSSVSGRGEYFCRCKRANAGQEFHRGTIVKQLFAEEQKIERCTEGDSGFVPIATDNR